MADRDIERIADLYAAKTLRILGTGSREWTDRDAIRRELLDIAANAGVLLRQVTFVHGGQGTVRDGKVVKGFDLLAADVAATLEMAVEEHRANWSGPCRDDCAHGPRRPAKFGRGTYCQQAGNNRNGDMVRLGADQCVAAPLGKSPGTRDCITKAEAAGIPVRNIGDPDPAEQPDLFGETRHVG